MAKKKTAAVEAGVLTAEELYALATRNREWPGTVKNVMDRDVPAEGVDLIRVMTPESAVYVVEYKVVAGDDTETLIYNVYPCGSEPLKG